MLIKSFLGCSTKSLAKENSYLGCQRTPSASAYQYLFTFLKPPSSLISHHQLIFSTFLFHAHFIHRLQGHPRTIKEVFLFQVTLWFHFVFLCAFHQNPWFISTCHLITYKDFHLSRAYFQILARLISFVFFFPLFHDLFPHSKIFPQPTYF